MAQEYLHRHIYQSGSQTTATWACWLKVHKKAGTSNVVLNNNAKMTEQPFEKKEDNFGGIQYNLDGTPMNTGRII